MALVLNNLKIKSPQTVAVRAGIDTEPKGRSTGCKRMHFERVARSRQSGCMWLGCWARERKSKPFGDLWGGQAETQTWSSDSFLFLFLLALVTTTAPLRAPTNSVSQYPEEMPHTELEAAVSLLLLKAPVIHCFFLFLCIKLCRDTSTQFLIILFCSNIPYCSGSFNCLLGHYHLKVNHDYAIQNFQVFLSFRLTTSYNELINPPGSH